MKYCPKCGAELMGTFCTECGCDTEKYKNQYEAERKQRKRAANRKTAPACWLGIAIGGTVLALTATLALVVFFANIFRSGRVDNIDLGFDRDQVIKALGEADYTSDSKWEYYSSRYDRIIRKIEKTESKEEALLNGMDGSISEQDAEKIFAEIEELENQIEGLQTKLETVKHHRITVHFDAEGHVTSVILNKNYIEKPEDGAEEKHVVKKTKLLPDILPLYAAPSYVRQGVRVYYKGGDYRMETVSYTNAEEIDTSRVGAETVKFKNAWGECVATLKIEDSCRHTMYTTDEGVVHAPTCSNRGYTAYTCEICRYVCQDDLVSSTGIHIPSGDGVVTEPSCQSGYTTYECSVCKQEYQDDFVAAIHQYNAEKTCTECGYKPYTRVDSVGNKSDTGRYILFGSYPRTEVTDSGLISTLTAKAGTTPKSDNDYNWISYGYYLNGSISDYMWYQDVAFNGKTYRGVYFTACRPYWTGSGSVSESHQNENGYYENTVYWFEFEPILWKIVAETGGAATLICETLIDSREFDDNNSHSNHYAQSNIRAWLNDSFYKTAFNELERELILLTTVDNSEESTGDASNPHICEKTLDYIYLPSYMEATTYFKSNTIGQKQTTDYARCQGAFTYSGGNYDGNGYWWLRSPYSNYDYYARLVGFDGYVGYSMDVYYTNYGICPVLQIRL